MPHELPPNVMTHLKQQLLGNHEQHMAEALANIASSDNIARHTVVRQFDEPSPASARSIDKVLRNPK